jgi:hypothetical protein
VEQVKFIKHPTLAAGCSPDGLVDEDGGVEIKSVIPTVQIDTVLAGGYPSEHKAQIQGCLWITGASGGILSATRPTCRAPSALHLPRPARRGIHRQARRRGAAKGSTKAEAIAAVIEKMDQVVSQQPIHAADREPAIETAKAFVNLIPEDDAKDVSVSVSGSLGWTGVYPDSHVVSNAQVSVYASLVKREEKVAA